ncbi:MAG: Wzz/FepE/Etk N-terminal domain-containing protein, partial [Actinomycetota bacterium]
MASFRSRTFTEYLQIIWRRKLLIFLLFTGMLISTFLVIERLPNVYESRATVVTSGTVSDRQAVNARVAATTERLTSRAFLEPVVDKYDPYNNRGNIDAALNQMRQDLKVDTTYRSDFPERLTISYRHTNPQLAKDVATDLVSVFGKMNEAVEKQAADKSQSLASEIASVENRLREMGKL